MPEIVLPELSPEPTASGTVSATPTPTTADTTTGSAAAPSGDEVDPLDAVMRDALAAAEKQQPADPVVAEPAVEVGQAPAVDQTAKGVTQGTTTDTPVVEPAAASQTVKQTPKASPDETPAAQQPGSETPAPTQVARVPAPVETREVPAAPAPVVAPKPAVVVSRPAPVNGGDWLKTRTASNYTLQLVGARDRAAIQKFVLDYGIAKPHAIFERDLNGEPWYSLVAGDYPNRDAAIAARTRLPKRLERSGVWPRTFESIQKTLK